MKRCCVVFSIASVVFLFLAGSLYAQVLPAVVRALGYSQNSLISYDKAGEEEYFTFYDIASSDRADTITFIVRDGKIIDTIKGQTAKFQDR
jgi:hypothetical protein